MAGAIIGFIIMYSIEWMSGMTLKGRLDFIVIVMALIFFYAWMHSK